MSRTAPAAAGLDLPLPHETLTPFPFPRDHAEEYAEGLVNHEYALGEEWGLRGDSGYQDVYMDGIKVGTLHNIWRAGRERVAKGGFRSLHPRIEYVMTDDHEDTTGTRYTSATRAVFTYLSNARGIRI